MKAINNHLKDRVIVYAAIWCFSYIGSLVALRTQTLSLVVGIMLTAITVLSFSVFLYKYYRSIHFMDELQIKIQMESVVIAFALSLLLLMTLGLLDLVIRINPNDWSFRHLLPFFVCFYFVGFFISQMKYHTWNEKQH
jgi:hypothetical protein